MKQVSPAAVTAERLEILTLIWRIKAKHAPTESTESRAVRAALEELEREVRKRDGSPGPRLKPMPAMDQLRLRASRPPISGNVTAAAAGEPLTDRQRDAIYALAKAHGWDADLLCKESLACRPGELSRKAASAFIEFLNAKSNER